MRRLLTSLVFVLLVATRVSAAQVTLAWDPNPEPDIAGYIVEYGPTTAPFTQAVDTGKTTAWALTSATAGVSYTFRVVAYNAAGERSDPSSPVTAVADSTASTLTADRSSLAFGVIAGSPAMRTSSQAVRLTQSGAGSIAWTASSSASWLQVSPASGSGSAVLTVSLVPGAIPSTGTNASITITAAGATNTISPIAVSLSVIAAAASRAPFGAVDSPSDNATGVTGSMAMTGWAVDDVDVTRVRIFRDPVSGEGAGLVYVGDATLVEDARPDVAALFPAFPQNARAGWGYLLLTNMLPSLGNGTFRFSAYADDPDGHTTLLGTRTVTCTNSTATQPFGAIDTPLPGETVAGGNYTSFGWVLARAPRRADVPGGGSTTVFIDGAPVGSPSGWSARADLSALFPASQYPGIGNAVAAFAFDTTSMPNGVHTMAWVVTDNQGGAAGVGSRYFRVFNGSASLLAPALYALQSLAPVTLEAEIAAASIDGSGVDARRGYALDLPLRHYAADADGRVTLQAEELDRVEIQTSGATEGFLVSAGAMRPLPVGSSFDASTGAFTWQPGVAFVGPYDFVFARRQGGRVIRQDVRIVLNPKGSNRVGPQVVIDVAGSIVAGWAADLDSPSGTGIDTIHVWAYPRDGASAPIFLGAASYGGERPDVAGVYGDRFLGSGFGIRVPDLPAGTYDLAVFAWSSARGGWLPAKVVAAKQ